MSSEPGILEYQRRPYRPTWRQRRRRAWRWLTNLTFAGGVPALPFLVIAVAALSLTAFFDSLRDGPHWVTILSALPALGAAGLVLCYGVTIIALLDDANGWSRRWRDHRELRRLRQRTSMPWFATRPRRRTDSNR